MWKRIRATLGRITRGGRATPKHRAHDPREARRYRAGGDIDIAKPGSTDARIPVGLGACGVGVNRVLGVLEA
jgi:hypothetical protein